MAELLYRVSSTATTPTSTSIKGAPLNNLEIDGNFKSINDDLALKAYLASPTFTGDVVVDSVTALKVPVGLTAERPTGAVGLIRYNSEINQYEGYKAAGWGTIGGGATGGGLDDVFYENSKAVTTSYTITENKNAMSTGPITIEDNVEVNIPTGSTWVVI